MVKTPVDRSEQVLFVEGNLRWRLQKVESLSLQKGVSITESSKSFSALRGDPKFGTASSI